jgi:CRP/FNR family cyclic AMP-dependent transcriptional regulator
MKTTLLDSPHDNTQTPAYMMDGLVYADKRLLDALRNSRLVDNLREFEFNILANLITVKYFEINELVVELEDDPLKDALMILVEGEIEVTALVGNEPVSIHLQTPGDLARVVSFVGGTIMNISARILVKKNSAVLLLQRSKLETLLHAHPSIVYCVLRNLVLHVHGVSRRKNVEKEEITRYVYRTQGLY